MSEYLADLPYVRQFVKELAPELIALAAAFGGGDAPGTREFRYCELGTGPGDTLVTLAAANPEAEHTGIDLNPAHVELGAAMARRGGLTNVRFVAGDLSKVGAEVAGPFDFVTAHGLLSWVSPATQDSVARFAQERLRDGGLLLVTYNALPGWAAVAPLRALLLEAAGTEGDALSRARRALDAARRWRDAGALYFRHNPAALEMLATMERHGPVYVAHECLQQHWRPMAFAEVHRAMASRGLHFAGQLPLHRNVERLAVPPSLSEMLSGARDDLEREAAKDLATNAFFRADVYRRGRPSNGAPLEGCLRATPFGTLLPAARLPAEVSLAHGVLAVSSEAHVALREELAERPGSLTDARARPRLAAFQPEVLREALVDLIAAEHVLPTRPGVSHADAYNRAVIAEPIGAGRPTVLACPAAGTGLPISALHTVLLRALTGATREERAGILRAYAASRPLTLFDGDRRVVDAGEQGLVLEREAERFARERLPKLVALGAFAPAVLGAR